MHRTSWGLRGGLLAAALSVALPAVADPLSDPLLTAEGSGERPPTLNVAAYGNAPIPPGPEPVEPVISTTMLDGTWKGSGSDGGNMGWSLTYTIRDGRYTLEGYPPLREAGGVALASPPVVNVGGETTLEVRFFGRVMDGRPMDDRTETWTLSADKQRFTRPVDMVFTRDPDATPPRPPAKDTAP
jgi:hypothetical protein